MRSLVTTRFGLIVMAAAVLSAAGLEPPRSLVEELGSEAYPERIAAESELKAWAQEGGEAAKKWLYELSRSSENPEVRKRALSVLKSVVITELFRERPGFVGIKMVAVKLSEEMSSENGYGIEIQFVNSGTPAEKAGLKATDVILNLDGKGWANQEAPHEFAGRIEEMRGGDKIHLEIFRNGKTEKIELVLASRPWSAGVYRENLQLRGDPFGAQNRFPSSEKDAENAAFQEWMKRQQTSTPVR
jgi:predicted metalloprotease with PDZ domain